MNKHIIIIFTIKCLFSLEIYSDFASVIDSQTTYERPFLGGFNKPKIQWVDWDNDNDDDLFLLDEDGSIKYYINNGCLNNDCEFILNTTSFYNIENISWFYIADFDLDNDYDIVTQNPNNLETMIYYENNQNNLVLIDVLTTNSFETVQSDPVMTPTFADIDLDGDLDFFTGNTVGTVTFYENIGFVDNLPLFEFVTNFWEEIYIVGSSQQRHGASAINFIDMDQDNDLDLAWGDYFQQSLYIIWNNGNAYLANMDIENVISQFPQNDPVFTAGLNMPSFTDIDNDGDNDLFVTVLSGAYGFQLINNFIFYENINEFTLSSLNFIKTVDFLSDINPVFADIDFDGDMDLFFGTDFDPSSFPWHGKIKYYKNIGNDDNYEPIWSFENDIIIDIDGNNFSPEFVDLDFDDDLDLLVGNFNGEIHYYRNIGDKYNFDFEYVENISNIDLSGYSTPKSRDIDNDDDLDLLIGHMNGTLYYYENIGDKYNYNFQFITDNFNNIDLSFRSSPELFDFNKDGKLDLFVGSGYNNINYYENVGTLSNPTFTLNELINFPNLGNNVSPAIYNSEQIVGMLTGVSTGGMYFLPFENDLFSDLNNDFIINVYDVIILIEYILYNYLPPLSTYYLDINGDFEINVIDVFEIVSIILN